MMKTQKTNDKKKRTMFESVWWAFATTMCAIVEIVFLAREIRTDYYLFPYCFNIVVLIALVVATCYWVYDVYRRTKYYFYD